VDGSDKETWTKSSIFLPGWRMLGVIGRVVIGVLGRNVRTSKWLDPI